MNFAGAGSSVTLSSGTVITLRADGRLDVNANTVGMLSFDYRMSDGVNVDRATISLNVVDTNDETSARSLGTVNHL